MRKLNYGIEVKLENMEKVIKIFMREIITIVMISWLENLIVSSWWIKKVDGVEYPICDLWTGRKSEFLSLANCVFFSIEFF